MVMLEPSLKKWEPEVLFVICSFQVLAAPVDRKHLLVRPRTPSRPSPAPPPHLFLRLPSPYCLLSSLHTTHVPLLTQVQEFKLLSINIGESTFPPLPQPPRYALLGWAHAAVLFLGGQAALSNLTLRHGMVSHLTQNKCFNIPPYLRHGPSLPS